MSKKGKFSKHHRQASFRLSHTKARRKTDSFQTAPPPRPQARASSQVTTANLQTRAQLPFFSRRERRGAEGSDRLANSALSFLLYLKKKDFKIKRRKKNADNFQATPKLSASSAKLCASARKTTKPSPRALKQGLSSLFLSQRTQRRRGKRLTCK